MGRFLAIVIVLVAIALLVNHYLPRHDAEQAAPAEPPGVEAGVVEPPPAEAPEAKAPPAKASEVKSPATDAAAAAEAPAADAPATKTPAAEVPSPKADVTAEETVMLGEGDLLMGIPGEGDLTIEEIDTWLADPKNHVALKPELPLGLAAGAGEIKGIDKNPLTRAKIELGRQLYFDPRLSVNGTVSCASCHDPSNGFAKDTQFGVGVEGQTGNRNSPVAYNRILSGPQFWDGRAESLEAQAVGPIENPIEMANTHEACVESVTGIDGYTKQFEAIFDDGVTIDNVGRAIASFERAIVTAPAPWDYYEQLERFQTAYADDLEYLDELKEDDPELYNQYIELKTASEEHPISESAIRGGKLFFSDKAGCTACHVGANFSDEKYHNLGVGMDAAEPDLGRHKETGMDADRGAFKTPTVRNVSLTAPYMHDGSQKTLMEVVEWYAKGGHPNDYLDENVKKLDLSDQDKQDLVNFMAEGLLSDFPPVESDRLPQ